jgi:DNA modification methylase
MLELHKKSCEKMDEVRDHSVDLVITSPPYKDEDGYSPRLMRSVASELNRVMKPGTLAFVNFGQLAGDKSRPLQCAAEIGKYLEWVDTIIWVKSNPFNGGHYTPINSDYRMNNMWEYIFQFSKGKAKIDRLSLGIPYMHKSNVSRYGVFDDQQQKKDIRCAGNVWYVSYPTVQSKKQKPHKDMFPEEIPTRCLKLANLPEGSTVLDPFLGSATTARAARKMKMKTIGYEINPKFWTGTIDDEDEV